MITTIVLVKAEPRLIPQCAKHLAGIEGVTDVYSVSGEWDLVVLVKVPQYEDIAKIVTERFPTTPGLVKTTTLTAFKAYSKADLEQGWDVGAETDN
jgi:DNA-binding Lrp family transcriptional regulator